MSRFVYGKRSVLEAFETGLEAKKIYLQKGQKGDATDKIMTYAKNCGAEVQVVARDFLERKSNAGVHQGIGADFPDFKYAVLERLIEHQGPGVLLVLDHIEDPRNLGAIIRCAEVHNVIGVVIPTDRAAQITPSAEKASAGAASRVPVAQVTNLGQALEQIKKAEFWTYGLDGDGDKVIAGEDFAQRTCLVLGNEGEGLKDRTKKICDQLVNIPQYGKVGSLNVSVAAGIALYEVMRQRFPAK